MRLFKKKDKVIDLTDYYQKNKDKFDNLPENKTKPEYQEIQANSTSINQSTPKTITSTETSTTETNNSNSGGFFGGFFGGSSTTPEPTLPGSERVNPDEKRRKLAKRLGDMTSKIEDLSNQIYHLQQRLEVVERKLDINRF